MSQSALTGRPIRLVERAVSAAQRRARAQYFVGREAELADFARVLGAGDLPRFVYVHGPGGIGKSSLLDGFGEVAEQAGCGFVRLDARQLAPAPAAMNQAVANALDKLPARTGRARVLTLDHAEHMSALDGWLRDRLLPSLPADMVFVMATRQAPSALWRADPGVSELLTEYALAPLDANAVAEYLERRGVDAEQTQAIAAFACGHPLPLALAADQVLRDPSKLFAIERFPDLVRALVEWLLRDVACAEELQALQACATVRRLDEPLLAAMLDVRDVSRQYDWVADQPYVERQTAGLVIHDLVREVVIRDLRARNLAYHHRLVRRAIAHLMANVDSARERFQVRDVPDIIYALRHEPHIREQFGFGQVSCYVDAAGPPDIEVVAAEVEQLEGRESRLWFDTWVQAACSDCLVLRDATQQVVAFALYLRLDGAAISQAQDDPCLRALDLHLREHAPLRAGEQILLARFRMAFGTHQAPTPVWAELRSHLNARMFTPGISMLASVSDMAYPWPGMEENAEYLLLPDSQYQLGGHEYKISAHDLRREPALEWAHNTVERVLRGGHAPELKPAPITLLDKAAFAQAVHAVLRHFHDEAMLARNPLLQSPALRRYAAHRDTASLRELFVQTSARQPEDGRALLKRAFFESAAAKQQALASEMYISERTLRRRLREAESKLTEALWTLDTTP